MVFTLAYERNEMMYVWMNEANSVFATEASLVAVQYVEPSFFGSLDVKSMIPRSHGIWMNDMKDVTCYMQYDIYYVKDFMCCVQYDKYDDACYSNGMTFLIQIWLTNFCNHNLVSPLNWLSIIILLERSILTHACPWCVLAYTNT